MSHSVRKRTFRHVRPLGRGCNGGNCGTSVRCYADVVTGTLKPTLSFVLTMKICYSITKTRQFKYAENVTTKKKNEIFQIKNSDIFHISAHNIDCGYSLEPPQRSGSNEYPQFMFLNRNKKNNVYPCKPQ